ncbi:MAG: trigger factor [Acidimicrobiales bacterium]
MKATVEALEGNKVKLSVEVDEQEFESAVDAAFKKIARDVRVPGFRPGKAPRRVLESHIGAGAGRAQALNDALPNYYSEAVLANEVDVIAPPDIEITGGEESGPVKFDAIVEIRPVITVSGYGDLTVEIPSPSPSDEEINAQLERFRSQYGELEIVERAAELGDYVTVDIEGSQNDEVLEGLVASAYLYEVGSAGIVPELDEQMTGVSAGDTRAFDAPHPNGEEEDPLHFEVSVTEVKAKVLPELNDEFAVLASEFETMSAWRDDIVTRMTEVRKAQSQMMVREKIGEALAELVSEDLPEPLVAAEMNERLQDMAMRLQAQGMSLEQWLQFSGTETDQFLDDLKTTADRSARVDLALRAIALAESIEALEVDLDLEFEAVAARVEQKSDVVRAQLTEAGHMPALKVDITKRKALDWLTESVSITDESGNAINFADLAVAEEEEEDTFSETPASEEDDSE